jgi:hypothetical protein
LPLYQDPETSHRLRPSLVKDLLTTPASVTNHQLENQATIVIAWLVDRSRAVATAILELFLGQAGAVGASAMGARTQLSLPKPGGGYVFPDLSVDVAGRKLQLLVEVKVGSAFHEYELSDGRRLSQPEFYRHAWWKLPLAGEASTRAVGTLTRQGGATKPDVDAMRARDVTWSELRDRLRALDADGVLEDSVALVTQSLVEAITAQIAVTPPDPAKYDAWYERYAEKVALVASALAAAQPGGSTKKISGREYRGLRVGLLDRRGRDLFFRVYASPAGSRLNMPGWPDALIVGVERDANGNLEEGAAVAVSEVGFPRLKDIDGWWVHRDMWPIERAAADPEAIASDILQRIAATGLVDV